MFRMRVFFIFIIVFAFTAMEVFSQHRDMQLTFYMKYNSGELNPAEGAWSTPEGQPWTENDFRTREATGFMEGNETEFGIQYLQNFASVPYLSLGLNLKLLTSQTYLYEAQNNTNRSHFTHIEGNGSADHVFSKRWVGVADPLEFKEVRASVSLIFNADQLGANNFIEGLDSRATTHRTAEDLGLNSFLDGLYASITLDNRMLASVNVGYQYPLGGAGFMGLDAYYEFWALPPTAEINERGPFDPFYQYSYLITDVLGIALNYTSPQFINDIFSFSSTASIRFNGPSLGTGGTLYIRDSTGELLLNTDIELANYATYKYVGFLDNFEFRWENYIFADFDELSLYVGVQYNLRNAFYKGFEQTVTQDGTDTTLFSPELDLVHQVELRAGVFYALDLSAISGNHNDDDI